MNVNQTLQKAITHHQAGELQDAERLYRAILQEHPNDPDANHNLGVIAVQVKQPTAGLPFFKIALELNPHQHQYWLSYIDALIQSNHNDLAQQVIENGLKQGLSKDILEPLANRLIATQDTQETQKSIPKKTKSTKSKSTSTSTSHKNLNPQEMALLVTLFNEGKLAEAVALAQSITVRFPAHGIGWKVLGIVLQRMGQVTASLLPFQKAAELLPHDAEAHNNLGVTLNDLGRLAEAEGSYKKAIKINPNFTEAHSNLGSILTSLGRCTEAVASYRNAIKINPNFAEAHSNLGITLHELVQLDEAEASYRRALTLNPNYAEAHSNLGLTLQALSRLDEAEISFRRALEIKPNFVKAHSNLGIALQALSRLAEAESSYRNALKIKPDYAEAHSNLGVTLNSLGRLAEAESSYRRALEIAPGYANAHSNLGITLQDMGRLAEAEASHRRALEITPNFVKAHSNLGITLQDMGRLAEAEISHRRALELDPEYAPGHHNLGIILAYLSKFDQVVAESNKALQLKPDAVSAWEQRLYTFSYHPDLTAREIYTEFIRWGDRFPDPVVDFSARDRTPGRRLRVGYVSPDFRRHTSRFFFLPLFSNHDPLIVELFAYSNVGVEDDATQKFKSLFHHWRNIRGIDDSSVAQMIRDDKIDILVDACSHMRDDRLGVFTLKPAPIQVTWLGAAWTTGLKMMDYAMIDPHMAPEGTLTRETIVRLPKCFVAYNPPEETAEIAPPPCLKNGYITFGYSGRTERLNHHTFRVWGEILRQMPSARLILDYKSFADPLTQAHYRNFMAQHGMNPDQVIMRRSANIFSGLNDFDILLDCFPHSGGTMLFDALWMGVPALTLSSRPPVGRIGTTLMINLGLPEWVTNTENEYICKAITLAQDTQMLSHLRAGMRQRMQNSPLMDGPGFARGVESAYRDMYEKWALQTTP